MAEKTNQIKKVRQELIALQQSSRNIQKLLSSEAIGRDKDKQDVLKRANYEIGSFGKLSSMWKLKSILKKFDPDLEAVILLWHEILPELNILKKKLVDLGVYSDQTEEIRSSLASLEMNKTAEPDKKLRPSRIPQPRRLLEAGLRIQCKAKMPIKCKDQHDEMRYESSRIKAAQDAAAHVLPGLPASGELTP